MPGSSLYFCSVIPCRDTRSPAWPAVRAPPAAKQKAKQPHHRAARRTLAASFDDLVGDGEKVSRHLDAKLLCGLEVDHQFELGRLQHRHFGGLGALEDLAAVDA